MMPNRSNASSFQNLGSGNQLIEMKFFCKFTEVFQDLLLILVLFLSFRLHIDKISALFFCL